LTAETKQNMRNVIGRQIGRNLANRAILYVFKFCYHCYRKIFENDISVSLYFYFKGNFKHDNK